MTTFASFFTMTTVALLAIAIGCAIGCGIILIYKALFRDYDDDDDHFCE